MTTKKILGATALPDAGVICMRGWQAKKTARKEAAVADEKASAQTATVEASWNDLRPVDRLGLEVAYPLIPLVDRNQDGVLLERIQGIRRHFAREVGFLPPQIHICDNLELKPNAYRISLKGVVIGEGEVHAGMHLAINPGNAVAPLPGTPARDPAFGLPATWIEGAIREQALDAGYTVVDASTVVATHLHHLMQTRAHALLGLMETQALIDHFNNWAPNLINELTPKLIPLSTFTRVLQGLLEEGVNIRDMRSIVETLIDHAARTKDAAELLAQVRITLGHAILQTQFGPAAEIEMLVLEPDLERVLMQSTNPATDELVGIEPGIVENLSRNLLAEAKRLENLGKPPALLVPDRLRPGLSRIARRVLQRLKVFSHAEIPDVCTFRAAGMVGARGPLPG
jgi:flagellar biosynthesis protein FlhA